MAPVSGTVSHARPLAAVVEIAGLSRRFDGRTVLDDVNISIARGEFVVLLGRSGSGKSTILRAAAGLDHGVSGEGRVRVPEQRAVLFQDSRLLPWARAIDNVLLGSYQPDAPARAAAALEEVGLAGHEDKWPRMLSGGEQQRVALARSLMFNPELILADEPFSALDALTRLRMQTLLRQLVAHHQPAVLFVTHDVEEALRMGDRIIVLEDGRITYDRAADGIRDDPVRFEQARRDVLDRLGVPAD